MTANVITLLRIPLLALVVGLLYNPAPGPRFLAAGLVVLLILLDSLDGVVARALRQTSVMGSVLDIAADRAVELALWIVFADLDLIPVVIPLVVLIRGIFVDAFRGIAPERGLAPFDLMRSPVSRFLVKSPWLRTPYGLVKAAAFCLLALQHGFAVSAVGQSGEFSRFRLLVVAAQAAAWLALAFCLVRGIPVLIEAPGTLMRKSGDDITASPHVNATAGVDPREHVT